MKLCSKFFSFIYELVDYVNENDIQKENIQEIIRTNGNVYLILYWQ